VRGKRGEDADLLFRGAAEDLDAVLRRRVRGAVMLLWGDIAAARGGAAALYDEAIRECGRSIEIDPASPQAFFYRGVARVNQALDAERRGEDSMPIYRDAEADLTRSIELDPSGAGAWVFRARLRANRGAEAVRRGENPDPHYEAALEDCAKALPLAPAAAVLATRAIVRVNWATHRRNAGRLATGLFEGAIEDATAAIAEHAAPVEPWLARGLARVNLGVEVDARGGDASELWAAGIEDFDAALARRPGDADILVSRGVARYWRGLREARAGGGTAGLEAAVADWSAPPGPPISVSAMAGGRSHLAMKRAAPLLPSPPA
jgi:tetratricopeptide (TPR) repeat protein